MSKQKIKTRLAAWSSYEFEDDLPEIIVNLQKLINDNPDHFDFKLDVELDCGYYNNSSVEIVIIANRWETDEEYELRIAIENERKEHARIKAIRDAEENEKKEKQLYESLKRKFEKEIKESN